MDGGPNALKYKNPKVLVAVVFISGKKRLKIINEYVNIGIMQKKNTCLSLRSQPYDRESSWPIKQIQNIYNEMSKYDIFIRAKISKKCQKVRGHNLIFSSNKLSRFHSTNGIFRCPRVVTRGVGL